MEEKINLIPLTLEKAKELKVGDYVYIKGNNEFNVSNKSQRWRINGKVKRWKRNPNRIEIPVKFGLYTYNYVTDKNFHLYLIEDENAN